MPLGTVKTSGLGLEVFCVFRARFCTSAVSRSSVSSAASARLSRAVRSFSCPVLLFQLADRPIAGALIGTPFTSNIEPWQGQSQHVPKLFQCSWQPTWVQLAEFRCRAPASSKDAIFQSASLDPAFAGPGAP